MATLVRKGWWLPVLLLAGVALVGCGHPESQPAAPPPPEVLVSLPVTQEVTDYEEFPGRTDSVHTVEVRPRVTGPVVKVNFKEGADVKEGEVLFEIDPLPFRAEVNRAKAAVVQAEAHQKRLETEHRRNAQLLRRGAISQEEYEKVAGDRAEAVAAVGVAEANLQLAEQRLGYTKVRAPLSGRISRRFVDPGNTVKADETPLTVIVSLERMYVYFDLDERTELRLRRLVRDKKIPSPRERPVPVFMGLADEEGFPYVGLIDFVDNRTDPGTGTLRLRGAFSNTNYVNVVGDWAARQLLHLRGAFGTGYGLTPGLYVRVRLPIGSRYQATLVAEQALGRDQSQKFVYVVKPSDEVEYRRVQVGRLHDGLRVITDGLKRNERVVVSGHQRVRPGAKVAPKLVPMPRLTDQEPGARGQESAAKSQESGTRDQGAGKSDPKSPAGGGGK